MANLVQNKIFDLAFSDNEVNLPQKIEEFTQTTNRITAQITGGDVIRTLLKNKEKRKMLSELEKQMQLMNNKESVKKSLIRMSFHGDMIKRLLENDSSRHLIVKKFLRGE